MLAFWIQVKIEGENPPETSVPNPTFVQCTVLGVLCNERYIAANLDSLVEIHSNGGDTTAQVEVTRRTMADSCSSLGNKFDLRSLEVDSMSQNCVRAEKAKGIIDSCIMRSLGEEFLGVCNLGLVLGYVGLDMKRRVRRCQFSYGTQKFRGACDSEPRR